MRGIKTVALLTKRRGAPTVSWAGADVGTYIIPDFEIGCLSHLICLHLKIATGLI